MSDTNTPLTDVSPLLTGKAYDYLKFIALILLPALSTLYFTLGNVWGLPNVEQVIGTLVAIDTFLGVFLRISNTRYNASEAAYDGKIVVSEDEAGAKTFMLEVSGDPYDLDKKSQVNFKVQS